MVLWLEAHDEAVGSRAGRNGVDASVELLKTKTQGTACWQCRQLLETQGEHWESLTSNRTNK
jgi:hypothetical protein